MTSFLTQCPHCLTSFRITDKQVDAAEGMVRCGACLGIFSAPSNRIQMREQPDPEQLAAEDAAARAEEAAHQATGAAEEQAPPLVHPVPSRPDPATSSQLSSEREQDHAAGAVWEESEYHVEQDDELGLRNYDIPLGNLGLDEIYADARQEADDEDSRDWSTEDDEDSGDWLSGDDDSDAGPDDDLSVDAGERAAADCEDDEGEDDGEDIRDTLSDDSLWSTPTHRAAGLTEREQDAAWLDPDDDDSDTWLTLEAQQRADSLHVDTDDSDDWLILDEVALEEDTDNPEALSDTEDSDDELAELEDERLGDDEGAEEVENFDAGEDELDDEEDEDFEDDEEDDAEDEDDYFDDNEEDDEDDEDDEDHDEEDEEDDDDEDDDFDDDDWLDDDEVEESRSRAASLPADKRRYQQYLADLDADDALEPLSRRALDGIAPEPLLLGSGRRRSPWLGLALFGLNLVLALLLGLQYVAANITTLSRSTSLAPVLPLICQVLTCPAPSRSDLASLHSQELLVRAHPRYAEALEVSIIFRNDADRSQPFPALELGFSDLNNRQHSNRLFQPAEYLPLELREVTEMPARSSVQVVLELSDPGSVTTNYTLAFREP